MDQAETMECVALLQAAYPAVDFTSPTGSLYASELLAYRRGDAVIGIRRFIAENEWPSVAGVVMACHAARLERLEIESQQAALEAGDVVAAAPEEAQSILRSYFERIGKDPDEAAIEHAGRWGGPDGRIELKRRRVLAKLSAPRRPGAPARPVDDRAPGRSACGAAWGSPAVRKGGVWTCPSCGSPIAEGCR